MTLEHVIKRANELVQHTTAENTKTAYKSDLRQFAKWCMSHDLIALPCTPEILTAYLVDRSDEGIAVSTLARAVTAISQAHRRAGHASPTNDQMVRDALKVIRRIRGVAQQRAKPISYVQLGRMVEKLSASIRDRRDCALLVLGWACALRRSELVALDAQDIESVEDGLIVRIRRSKTDQEGEGRKIGIPFAGPLAAFCPVNVVRRWINIARCSPEDPVFFRLTKLDNQAFLPGHEIYSIPRVKKRISDKTVSRVIKSTLELAGYDNAGYSGHSLRSGFCTEAAAAGVPERAIMKHTGHRSSRVLRVYIRDGALFRADNPLKTMFGSSVKRTEGHDPAINT